MLQSDLLISFLSRILDSAILPTRVNLFLQGDNSAGQPVGGYIDSGQTVLFQGNNLVSQGSDMRKFERSGFFAPCPLKFRESAYKGRVAWFMVVIAEQRPMPSPKRGLHGKLKKADVRAGLETHTPNNLLVSGTQLIFQEKIVLEQREVRRDFKESLAEMDKNYDLKDGIQI
jgi:hypothetical protein